MYPCSNRYYVHILAFHFNCSLSIPMNFPFVSIFPLTCLFFHLSHVKGPLSWHLLLISPQWSAMQIFTFDSLLWRASVLERLNYFLCPWPSTKDQLEQGLFLSWHFPLTTTKLCWPIAVTDKLSMNYLFVCLLFLFVCLFVYWKWNAVWRHSKVHKQSLGQMVEEEAVSEKFGWWNRSQNVQWWRQINFIKRARLEGSSLETMARTWWLLLSGPELLFLPVCSKTFSDLNKSKTRVDISS